MFKSLSCDSLDGSERSSLKRLDKRITKQSNSVDCARSPTKVCAVTRVPMPQQWHSTLAIHSASLVDLNCNFLPSEQQPPPLQHQLSPHHSYHCSGSGRQAPFRGCNFTANSRKAVVGVERRHKPLMAKVSKMEAANSSNASIRPFENDDYDYLINCTDLITTCQEALQENNFEPDADQMSQSKICDEMSKLDSVGIDCQNCDEQSSIRAPSSAASSGLGLSLEEDLSLKYCQSDEEFSSFNSTATTESYSAKAVVAEFNEWLDYVENQLNSVCYCDKIDSSPNISSVSAVDAPNVNSSDHSIDYASEVRLVGRDGHCTDSTASDECALLVDPNLVIEEDLEEVDHDVVVFEEDDDEAEELMMSLQPMSLCRPQHTQLCLPEKVADFSVILASHKAFQNEFEKIAHRFIKSINQLSKQTCSGSSTSSSALSKSLRQQEDRCFQLWLRSLEYLVILQKHSGERCPCHYLSKKSKANSRATTSSNTTASTTSTLDESFSEQFPTKSGPNHSNSPLSRSYNSLLLTSTPYSAIFGRRRFQPNIFFQSSSGNSAAKKVELKSTGTGNSSVLIQNRRVQTRSGQTMIDQEPLVDTHTLDGSGSPGGDSGVYSSSTDKYEIIQKDIGYSSDADMSDAIEAHPHSSDQTSSQRSARKRQVRRRRTRTNRPRPWSFHADWTDWDYYQTPFIYSGEHASIEDMLNYDTENVVRKLTEFGENYETWINPEDIRVTKPPVVIEKPEIEAFCESALAQKTDACISTTPLPFLEKEFQVIDEHEEMLKLDKVPPTVTTTNESRSTQTLHKSVKDSACMTTPEPPIKQSPPQELHHETAPELSSKSTCKSCGCINASIPVNNNSNSVSSFKFYTSLALAGLFAFLFAVTQFSPEIHKTYSRPPPL